MNSDDICFMVPLSHQDSARLMGHESIIGYLGLEEQKEEGMERTWSMDTRN